MSTTDVPANAYTDSPALHRNWVLGSLQAIFWLFFHPSAWRSYLARIDPELDPEFNPLKLNMSQLRNPELLRLVVQLAALGPIVAGLLTGLTLAVVGASPGQIAAGALVSAALTSFSLLSSMLGLGLPAGLTLGLAGTIPIVTYILLVRGRLTMPILLALAVAGGMTYSLVGTVSSSLSGRRRSYSVLQQAGGSVVGLLVGGLGTGLLVIAAFVLSNALAVGIVDGILGGLAIAITIKPARGWRCSIVSGVGLGCIAAIFGTVMFWVVEKTITVASPRVFIAGGTIIAICSLGFVAAGFWSNWRLNLLFGAIAGAIVAGPVGGMVLGILSIMPPDMAKTLKFAGYFATVLFALFYVVTRRIAGSWAGVIGGAMACAGGWIASIVITNKGSLWPTLPLSMVGILFGLSMATWGPLLRYPFTLAWNTLLYQAEEHRTGKRASLLRWNSAFWDELVRLRLYGLEEHLLLAAEHWPAEGRAAISYLMATPQRWAAQAAQIEIEVRRLSQCTDIKTVGQAFRSLGARQLDGPVSALLNRFARVSQDVAAALNQSTPFHERLSLRGVIEHLDALSSELTRSDQPYADQFYPVAVQWNNITAAYLDELNGAIELRQDIDNPYISGVPLTEYHSTFVGRTDIAARIEQMVFKQPWPPLLLYGQRRMGKTSLLRNLSRLLPGNIVPLFIDGEGIAGSSNYADLLYTLSREMRRSAEQHREIEFPPLSRAELEMFPFSTFNEWLDRIEQSLGKDEPKTALLALDEFEAIDSVLDRDTFEEADFLHLLRHLVQHHPRFKLLLAGSHMFEDYQRWASYLINVQVIKIGYLEEADARQLIEHPVKDFDLLYEPQAMEHILAVTRGHPHLLQLLCYELVQLKNEQPAPERRVARSSDIEAAVSRALNEGRFFFIDIERGQLDEKSRSLLCFMAREGDAQGIRRDVLLRQYADELDRLLAPLFKLDLIEEVEAGYQFQVEMIRRWFAEERGRGEL